MISSYKYLLLDKIYIMGFSIHCTNRKWVCKINSSIQHNKNISSTLCLFMERNWTCLLQFYYRSSEGQPLDSSDSCIFSKGQRIRPVWSSICCESIMWILYLQIFAKLWVDSYVKGGKCSRNNWKIIKKYTNTIKHHWSTYSVLLTSI